jgi:hypothetical protein
MRKLFSSLLFTVLTLAAFAPAHAQVQTDLAIDRAQLQSDYQAIVALNLNITDEQGKTFWPLYREYRGEIQKVGDRMVNLVLDYSKSIDSMTDEQSTKMLDSYLAIKKDELKVRSAWVPKFRKALAPKAVTRLYQIENKLDAMIMFSAAAEIPLVQDKK